MKIFILIDELTTRSPRDHALFFERRVVVHANFVHLDHVEDHDGLGYVLGILDEVGLGRRDALASSKSFVVVALTVNSKIIAGSGGKNELL